MEIYPILNKPGKGKYVFIFILNERAVRSDDMKTVGLEAFSVGLRLLIRLIPEVVVFLVVS